MFRVSCERYGFSGEGEQSTIGADKTTIKKQSIKLRFPIRNGEQIAYPRRGRKALSLYKLRLYNLRLYK